MLVRRDEFRASKVMQQHVFENEKITVKWHTEGVEVLGDELMTGIKVKNNQTGEEEVLEANGLFYAIGHTPNTEFLEKQLNTDESGYILTTPGTAQTSIEGVYACGDVQDKVYRQAITSAGTGCMAALEAERFITENKH